MKSFVFVVFQIAAALLVAMAVGGYAASREITQQAAASAMGQTAVFVAVAGLVVFIAIGRIISKTAGTWWFGFYSVAIVLAAAVLQGWVPTTRLTAAQAIPATITPQSEAQRQLLLQQMQLQQQQMQQVLSGGKPEAPPTTGAAQGAMPAPAKPAAESVEQ